MSQRVVLAMSGGVDSSASAYLLKEQGYEVIGLFMRSGAAEETACGAGVSPASGSRDGRTTRAAKPQAGSLPIVDSKSHKQGCCSASDAADARRVADVLDIPFHALNFQDAFGRIKEYFADEYLSGRTPNPCVMCNNWLKFGRLWDFARQVGAERIATGHYARIETAAARESRIEDRGWKMVEGDHSILHSPSSILHSPPALLRGRDRSKDQSYVLFGIARDLLPNILFPVGDFEKPRLRELAREVGIRTADKPDSQEICFIPDNDYSGFLDRFRGPQETAGELVDTAGNVVGRHEGYQNFTVGQRRGLGVTFGAPRFVISIEADTKRVVIGTKEDLARDRLEADRLNWLVDGLPARFRCTAQIRYRHEPADAEVQIVSEDRLRVAFDEPQHGVAPGQAVVLYDGDRVLGGGWIR